MGCCPKPPNLLPRGRVRGPVRALLGPQTGQLRMAPPSGIVAPSVNAPPVEIQPAAPPIATRSQALIASIENALATGESDAAVRSRYLQTAAVVLSSGSSLPPLAELHHRYKAHRYYHYGLLFPWRELTGFDPVISRAGCNTSIRSGCLLRDGLQITRFDSGTIITQGSTVDVLRIDPDLNVAFVRGIVPELQPDGSTPSAFGYVPLSELAFFGGASTGQLFRTLPAGGVVAPSARPPPVAIQPRPLPPGQVTRQPLFRAVVAVATGQDGVNIRSWASPEAPLVGFAPNGFILEVYQIGIPQGDGQCPQCQWWHVAGGWPSAPPSTPNSPDPNPGGPPPIVGQAAPPVRSFTPPVGFVRAIGPQGEWNLRRASDRGLPVGYPPPPHQST